MSAKPKSVCIPCRRVYKGEGRRNMIETREPKLKGRSKFPRRWMGTGAAMQWAPEKCPECGGTTVFIWHGWRPPKRTNDRAWKQIAKGNWWWEKPKMRQPYGSRPRLW